MRDNIIRIALVETCALKQTHNLALAGRLAVERVFVLLCADSASQNHIIFARRESLVCVVKYDLDIG